ncbi:MAG TPA: radical SAM protein [Candidatus Nanoarchaeia archaeon]|nr:radical SAM protein [Candidatus Nanoarchaeia archaeon]
MAKVVLVYPFFQPSRDNSIFRFPPLGLGYLASALQSHGVEVELVDCTFMTKHQMLDRITRSKPQIVGVYSMFSMKKTSLEIAMLLRGKCDLLVVGGPLPTLDPTDFLDAFDVVAIGEGEETLVDIVNCVETGESLSKVKGIVYKEKGLIKYTSQRALVADLDSLGFPSRELFDNDAYQQYYLNRFGYSTTPLISSRGCPFSCDFCSRPVFGTSFRSRSPENIVAEAEEIATMGYERIWFADDCFTLKPQNVKRLSDLMLQRGVDIEWECLSRVDTLNVEVARSMKRAGCVRVFFGIESGNDGVLSIMNKHITTAQARHAVLAAKEAGLQVGAFFIVGYPGETDKTVLDTVRFASRLPLDYLSFTLPYPIPGTALHERVKDNGGVSVDDWEEPKNWSLIRHKLLYGSSFSETKLKFAIAKAQVQFRSRRFLGDGAYNVLGSPFEGLTDQTFKLLK